MPKGLWDEKNISRLPGSYNRFLTKAYETIKGGNHGVLAMPIKADWGKTGEVVEITSLAELKENFGEDFDFSSYKLGRIALLGKPEKLLLYRVVDQNAHVGSVNLQNDEETPKDVIALKTKYKSSRPFNITVLNNISDENSIDLILYDGTTEINRIEQVANNVDSVVEAINLSMDEITATKIEGASGGLAIVSNVTFTGGNDGCSEIKLEQYLEALNEFKKYNFDGFVLDGVTDREIQNVCKSFILQLKENGTDVIGFFGGDDDINEANSASLNFNNENIVNVGIPCTYEGRYYSAAEVAVYIAALTLSLNLKESLCYRETIFDDVFVKLDKKQMLNATKKGTLILVKEDDKVIILDDKNTYTTYTEKKGEVFGELRCTRFINIVNQDTLTNNKTSVGKITDDEDDKLTFICSLKKYFEAFQDAKLIRNFTVEIDEDIPEDLKSGDAIFWKWNADYVKVKKRIFGTGYIR